MRRGCPRRRRGRRAKVKAKLPAGRGAHTQGRREGLGPAGAELGPQGGIAPTESKACYLIENQINSRGGKKGKKVPLSQLWEAEMMGAGCPKRWGTQRERELQNKTKKMQQSREGRREGNRGGSEARGPWGRALPPGWNPRSQPTPLDPGEEGRPGARPRGPGGRRFVFEGTPVLGRSPSFLEFCSRFKKKFYVTRESPHFCGIQIFLN